LSAATEYSSLGAEIGLGGYPVGLEIRRPDGSLEGDFDAVFNSVFARWALAVGVTFPTPSYQDALRVQLKNELRRSGVLK
jgi:hypothetical protein